MPILAALLTQNCLLCAAASGAQALCAACAADLPRLPAARCTVCAAAAPDGALCGACLKHTPRFDATHVAWRYGFPLDKLIQSLKYGHRLAVAAYLADTMLAGERPDGDLIVPVPLASGRLRERGFNQALEIARPLARALKLPLVPEICRREIETAPQADLPWSARRRNIRRAFACGVDLSGKTVIVVDDVMTTGSTLDDCARALKTMGATRVVNWVAARALRGAP